MNLQVAAICGPYVQIVRYHGGAPLDAIYIDGVEVARVREEALPQGGCFFVAIDLVEREARAFVGFRCDWTAAVEWLLRRNHCDNDQIAQAIRLHDAAEEDCDARR